MTDTISAATPLTPVNEMQQSSPRIEQAIEELVSLLENAHTMDYIGENISQLEHALQCAKFAADCKSDDELIIGALLHDVGHFCNAAKLADRMDSYGAQKHEKIGAEYVLSLGFPKRVADVILGHVQAKRYLTWKNPTYYEKLSEASKKTLEFQGGPLTDAEAEAFEKSDLFEAILKLRHWDDKAKVVGMQTPPLSTYVPIMRRLLARAALPKQV